MTRQKSGPWSTASRVGAAVRAGALELRRTPLLLALLVVAPGYVTSSPWRLRTGRQ